MPEIGNCQNPGARTRQVCGEVGMFTGESTVPAPHFLALPRICTPAPRVNCGVRVNRQNRRHSARSARPSFVSWPLDGILDMMTGERDSGEDQRTREHLTSPTRPRREALLVPTYSSSWVLVGAERGVLAIFRAQARRASSGARAPLQRASLRHANESQSASAQHEHLASGKALSSTLIAVSTRIQSLPRRAGSQDARRPFALPHRVPRRSSWQATIAAREGVA